MKPTGQPIVSNEDIATLNAARRILDGLLSSASANLRNRANAGAHYIELVLEDVAA